MMIKFGTLSPPIKKSDTFLMADYVELLCLTNPDGELSINDAITTVYHSVESETAAEVEISEKPVPREEYAGEINDRQIQAGGDWLKQLEFRKTAFGEYYPFCIVNDRLICSFDFSEAQRIYIYLLLCSNLRVFKKDSYNKITTNFELISASALKAYLPNFTVHAFGKSKKARKEYPTKLADAIDRLARNMNERNICDRDDIGEQNTGDGGLDVVAWHRPWIKDDAPGSLICFGQCACSPEAWEKKQIESHYINWRHTIDFIHFPANFMFIPVCFRDSNGKWFNKSKIRDSILMDRYRICNLLKDNIPTDIDYFEPLEAFEEEISKN